MMDIMMIHCEIWGTSFQTTQTSDLYCTSGGWCLGPHKFHQISRPFSRTLWNMRYKPMLSRTSSITWFRSSTAFGAWNSLQICPLIWESNRSNRFRKTRKMCRKWAKDFGGSKSCQDAHGNEMIKKNSDFLLAIEQEISESAAKMVIWSKMFCSEWMG